jgi:hypothetical protein
MKPFPKDVREELNRRAITRIAELNGTS